MGKAREQRLNASARGDAMDEDMPRSIYPFFCGGASTFSHEWFWRMRPKCPSSGTTPT